MADNKTLILDHKRIEQKIDRIAYQIHEATFEEKEVILVGILERGYLLAERIQQTLERISSSKHPLYSLSLDKTNPRENDIVIDLENKSIDGKVVVLVDDVLNTGKTLIYGTGRLLQFPLKQLITVALVDRKHRLYPVRADYVGLTLATTMQEHIFVELGNGQDAVYLE